MSRPWASRVREALSRVLPGARDPVERPPASEGNVARVELPEAIGEPVEELREVHDEVTAKPRLGPAEAEAESRTRPSGLTLYDEIRQEEESSRRDAAQQLSDTPQPDEKQD